MSVTSFCKSLTLMAVLTASSSVARADFIPIAGFDQQLFPSLLIATATTRPTKSEDPTRLGDPLSVMGVEVVSPGENTPIRVTIECDDFFEPSIYSGTLSDEGATYRITPKIKYRFQRLAQCDQAAPTTVTFRVQLGDGAEEEHVLTCTMRSINDCPFAIRRGEEMVDASFAFAAYVNEQHPFVDKLLREALDIGSVRKFTGTLTNNPDDVVRQAYALWDLLVARDIRYSSITATAAVSDNVYCQHVRMIEDSINNSQANCVDGSVLWVSLMRKIGINSFLVVTPDHCYAGFFADREQKICFAIETTLLGDEVDLASLDVPEAFETAVPADIRNDASFASFVAAILVGTAQLNQAVEQQKADEPAKYVIINIADMRKQGILPIAFQNTKEFVWRDVATIVAEEGAETEMTASDESSEWTEESAEDSESSETDAEWAADGEAEDGESEDSDTDETEADDESEEE